MSYIYIVSDKFIPDKGGIPRRVQVNNIFRGLGGHIRTVELHDYDEEEFEECTQEELEILYNKYIAYYPTRLYISRMEEEP